MSKSVKKSFEDKLITAEKAVTKLSYADGLSDGILAYNKLKKTVDSLTEELNQFTKEIESINTPSAPNTTEDIQPEEMTDEEFDSTIKKIGKLVDKLNDKSNDKLNDKSNDKLNDKLPFEDKISTYKKVQMLISKSQKHLDKLKLTIIKI